MDEPLRMQTNEPDTGLNGWLSPEGEYFPCQYEEHSQIAFLIFSEHVKSKLLKQERLQLMKKRGYLTERDTLSHLGWIPMGATPQGRTEDYFFIRKEIGMTEAQREWCKNNQQNLSRTQKGMIQTYMK